MSSDDSSLMASIIYYSQEKYFHHVLQAANVGLERYSSDPALQFFRAYGILGEDHIHDAISELEGIQSHPDTSLCAVIALLSAHKSCDTIDIEAVQELESSLKEIRRSASSTALYYASLFLWFMGHHDKAREYVDHMLKVSSGSKEGYVLKGWVDLTSSKPHVVKKSIKYLEQGTQDTKDVLGLMGKATYFMTQQNFSGALEVANQVTLACSNFLPALVLKMKLFLARQDWDQTIETGQRILEKDENNIDAWQILAVHELVKEGNTDRAADRVRNLIKALETGEPHNPNLHLKKILVISRLCGRHQVVHRLVSGFLERIFMATPSCALVATELGYLFILHQQVKEACLWYKEAMKLEENRLAALAVCICTMPWHTYGDQRTSLIFFHLYVGPRESKSGHQAYAASTFICRALWPALMAFLKDDSKLDVVTHDFNPSPRESGTVKLQILTIRSFTSRSPNNFI